MTTTTTQASAEDRRGFCASPWVEGFLRQNGTINPCCRNNSKLGDFKEESLEAAWNSETFQRFRKAIAEGRFPDKSCEYCYNGNKPRGLYSALYGSICDSMNIVSEHLKRKVPDEITNIFKILHFKRADENSSLILEQYFSALDNLIKEHSSSTEELKTGLNKLHVIGRIIKSYLEGDPAPPIVVPYRQPTLIERCNARCVHCPGKFAGIITDSVEMDEELIDKAFSKPEHIIDFFMGGAEFLLYRGWKKIAGYLNANGVRITLFTNGLLLTQDNIRYLIDNKVIKKLNISMDGATKNTLEGIRVNVKFDKLIKNISFLFQYADEKRYEVDLCFGYVMMRKNYHELPEFIKLIDRLRDGHKIPAVVSITVSALTVQQDQRGYTKFLLAEHHSRINRADFISTLNELQAVSLKTGVRVGIFNTPLAQFIDAGFPTPMLPENLTPDVSLVPVKFSFLVPTRSRPDLVSRFLDSIAETTSVIDEVEVVLCFDNDDVKSHDITHSSVRLKKVVVPKGKNMGELNRACFEASTGRYVMLLNDDVILRTKGWDDIITKVLASLGDDIALVHTNDLLFREKLCSFPMLSRKACLELGICPPEYKRYRIDDHIYDTYNMLAYLGHKRIFYLPDVVFEHDNYEHSKGTQKGDRHFFKSEDAKVCQPNPEIIELDAAICDTKTNERKQDALKLAGLIDGPSQDETRRAEYVGLLGGINDRFDYRKGDFVTTIRTDVEAKSSSMAVADRPPPVTVAGVTGELQ